MTDLTAQLEADITTWVNPGVRALKAYSVTDAEGLLKLDAMENPFGWPAQLRAEWGQRLSDIAVNRYPDPAAQRLSQAVRARFAVPNNIDMLFGNGSDELIQLIAMAVNGEGRKLMSPVPTFVMYELLAKCLGMDFAAVPLDDNFELDVDAMLAHIARDNPAVIFLAQPNNPTGNLWGDEKLRAILQAAQGLVVIDEAYTAFTDADYLPWLQQFPNLLIMRTFSKIGLAGLRLGMLFGRGAWLAQINKVRLPYNINTLTQQAALFALEHFAVLQQQTAELVSQRQPLANALASFEQLQVFPSQANFLLLRTPPGEAEQLHAALKAGGVLVKKLTVNSASTALLDDCLRVNVSSANENQLLLAALERILGKPNNHPKQGVGR